MAISDNAFQADQNENMDIVEVDVDPLAAAVVDPTSEIVFDNDEFETNADDEEDHEFTSSSDIGREDEFEGRGNPDDDDVEDINRHPEETRTSGQGSLSHHATRAHPDGRYSLHYTHGWSHVTRPYPTYAPGLSSSHYTSTSPPGHPYPYQHGTPSPPVHALPARHGFIPSSSHHSTSSPPADVYLHDHGTRPSSSHHATPSPSAHPTHSLGVGDEHTSTSRRPPAPHRHSSARSSSNRLRSSIPHAIEEISDFFRPPTAPAEVENPLIYLIAEHVLLHPSSVAAGKMSLVFNSGYLKEGWKREYVPQSQRDIYWLRWKVSVLYLELANVLCDMMRGVGRQPSEEVFEHYKRMRATYEAFEKKSEQMSTDRKSEVGGPSTGISLHSARSIFARQHGDTLEKKLQRRPTRKEMFRHLHTHGHDGQSFVNQRFAKIDDELTRRLEEMSTQTPDTSIDEDVIYLEVVPEVKGCVYGLGTQGYHHSISLGEGSSSRGPPYGPHELEELQQDHQRLQETLLKERMERQEQMQRDKMERQEETREMQDWLAHMEALLMQHLGIRPHVPLTPRTPPSPVTERFGPQSDDHLGHLTTEIAQSQSAHPHGHRPGHWTDPHTRIQRHLLDDHDEFMEQLMPPPRPPPRIWMGHALLAPEFRSLSPESHSPSTLSLSPKSVVAGMEAATRLSGLPSPSAGDWSLRIPPRVPSPHPKPSPLFAAVPFNFQDFDDYKKAVEKARRKIKALISTKIGGPFGIMRHASEQAHGANKGLEIVVRLLEPIKEYWPVLSLLKSLEVQRFHSTQEERFVDQNFSTLYIR
ncbi:hypothetical protein Syun_002424 [Stephania yunnanensis]|uniref:Uncharacterized protein n=1 Tax=Stephania yunnanensis TaxID=152371 RepID=A0AAP0LLF0_9MAGN